MIERWSGNANLLPLALEKHAKGEIVVAAKDGRRRRRAIHHLHQQTSSERHARGRVHGCDGGCSAEFPNRTHVSSHSLASAGVERGGDMADVPVAEFEEIARGGVARVEMREADIDVDRIGRNLHSLNNRNTGLPQRSLRLRSLIDAG